MEAISAGASVLAFIAVALKSTNTLYEIISGFRDASQQTKSLESAISDLRTVLTQLSNCKLAESNADLENTARLVNRCIADLQRYEDRLKNLRSNSDDPKAKRVWKNIKAHLREKNLQQIWSEINNHCTVLGFQLSLLQSNATLFCKDKLLELNNAVSERAAHDFRQAILLRQQYHDLSIVHHNVQSLKNALADRDTVLAIAEQMAHIPEMSQTQSADVLTLLQALEAFPVRLTSTSGSCSGTPGHRSEASGNALPSKGHIMVTESVRRLCQLAAENEVKKTSTDAETIIDDLTTVLLSTTSVLHEDDVSVEPRKRTRDAVDEEEDIGSRELERLCSLISASHTIEVNKAPPRTSMRANGRTVQKYRTKAIIHGLGKMEVTISKEWLNAPTHQRPAKEIRTMIQTFLKQRSQLSAVLVAYLHEFQVLTGFASLSPIISIGKTLPDDSPIFRVVREGDVKQLRGLLALRKATLRDRDSWGTPLLHYAMEQPEMCRFLVESGADIDELAINPTEYGHLYSHSSHPVSMVQFLDPEQDTNLVRRKVQCMHILADAGADPTLGHSAGFSDAFRAAAAGGAAECFQRAVALVRRTADLEMKRQLGAPSLIRHAENDGTGSHPLQFGLLLADGADIHALNDAGETCLHICIRRAFHINFDELEALIFLVHNDSDIRSVNTCGLSISDNAYTYRDDWDGVHELGGYRGDLWDAVLSKCGYNIREIRQGYGYPRTPQYTDRYKRENFERLWRGREESCPYFHDPYVWYGDGCFKEVGEEAAGEDKESMKRKNDEAEQLYESGVSDTASTYHDVPEY